MLWFKRWYHERFVNLNRDPIKAVISADVKRKSKRKVIRIIYDGCNDDSIACRHRNSYWFIRRHLHNQAIDTVAASDICHVSNCDWNAIESNETAQRSKTVQVADKIAEHTFINDTRQQTDIDSVNRFSCDDCSQNVCDRSNSFVTDVNEYGNGENDCGSLSKSKDPRLRTFKLSIVPEILCTICNPHSTSFDVKYCLDQSDSNRIQIQYDSDGNAESDEWPPKPFQQIEFLQRRIKELEFFISEIETRVKSNQTSSTNFNSSKCRACDEQPLTDWVIVSIELKSITSCESCADDDHFSRKSSPASFVQYYTTSEFSGRRTIVTVHQCPSNYSLSDRGFIERTANSSCQSQEYGIYESHSCALERLLWFVRLLDLNIQTGTPSSDNSTAAVEANLEAAEPTNTQPSCTNQSDSTMKFTSIAASTRRTFHSSDSIFLKDPMYPEFNYLLQEPCSSSKHSNVLTAQMFHNSLSSISTTDSPYITPPKKSYSTESINEYFGLNECGDIIIHIDHICEEKGFGFLLGRKKKIYCDVPYGEEVYEQPKFSLKFAVKRFFRAMSSTICKCTTAVGELLKTNFLSFATHGKNIVK